MTSTHAIADANRRRVEMDVQRICQSATPSYHEYIGFPPESLFLYQDITIRSGRMFLNNMDYQIAKIELQPLHEHAGGYENVLGSIRERRRRRKVAGDFEDLLDKAQAAHEAGDHELFHSTLHEALHEYVKDSAGDRYNPRRVTERRAELEESELNEPLIISVDGVLYVHVNVTDDQFAAMGDFVKAEMNGASHAKVDLWPDEVVVRGKATYVRCDVLFNERGQRNDIRFQ